MKTKTKSPFRLAASLVSLLSASLSVATAFANPSSAVTSAASTPIYKTIQTLDANVTYTFETSNLVPLTTGSVADTVINMQAYGGNGAFIAGNDDAVGLASRLDVTLPTTTTVEVYARAFSDIRRSRGTFTIKRAGVVVSTENDVVFGGSIVDVSSTPLVANTDVWTTVRADGPRDTILLVLSNLASRAIAADDDDGVLLASRVRTPEACSGFCQIAVGHFGAFATSGNINVAYDGDVAWGLDTDGDRLGNALEAAIGTLPSDMDKDTDDDGIDDASEFVGVDDLSDPLSLPLWGADPRQKDLFVEIDWVPSCNGCATPDAFQPTSADALEIVRLFGPDVRAHVDIGVTNPSTVPSEFGKWGAWGGAARSNWVPSNPANWTTGHCQSLGIATNGGFSPRRGIFHFHHATSGPGSGGQAQGMPATCSFGGPDGRTVGHEIGHHLGLDHGGNTGTGRVNAKPNYVSVMNYTYTFDTGRTFSRKGESTVLNPDNMNETTSTLSTTVIDRLKNPNGAWRLNVEAATKKIDWNRDGQYDAATRGAPTWTMGEFDGVGSTYGDQDFFAGMGPTLVWMNSPKRLYTFARDNADGKLLFRFATDLSNCKSREPSLGACVSWSTATKLSGSKGGSQLAPTVHPVISGGVEKLLVVHTDAAGMMWSMLVTSGGSGSTPKQIEAGGVDFEPTMAASGTSGKVRLYFRKNSVLYRRDYDAANDTWGSATFERTVTNNSIAVQFGVTMTQGYEVGRTSPSWYAAVADWVTSNQVQLFRYDATADRWTQVTGIWSTTQIAKSTPSIAYVPFTTTDNTKGQFYVSFAQPGALGPDVIRIMKSQGNDPRTTSSSRRLLFKESSIPLINSWGDSVGGPRLLYKMGTDINLRAVWRMKGTGRGIWFLPIADARFNLNITDQDDYVFIRGELKCSLGKGSCLGL